MIGIIYLFLGILILYFTGNWLVSGSTSLAKHLNVQPFIIALTLVAFGTSAPELAISVNSALKGYAGITIGNIVGSNIANVLFAIPLAFLIKIPKSSDVKKIDDAKVDSFTKEMIDNFFTQARSSYAEGLASLYTYERQIPEIAETKIQGLKKFYGVTSKEGLEFFEAHKSADVIHRAECEKLLDSLSKDEQEKAERASLLTARYLWNFLSGMTSKHKLETIAA